MLHTSLRFDAEQFINKLLQMKIFHCQFKKCFCPVNDRIQFEIIWRTIKEIQLIIYEHNSTFVNEFLICMLTNVFVAAITLSCAMLHCYSLLRTLYPHNFWKKKKKWCAHSIHSKKIIWFIRTHKRKNENSSSIENFKIERTNNSVEIACVLNN